MSETLSTVVRLSVVPSSVAQLTEIEIGLTHRPGPEGASPGEGEGFYDFPLSSWQCRRNCILFPSFKEGFKEGLDHSFKELQENLPLVSPVGTHTWSSLLCLLLPDTLDSTDHRICLHPSLATGTWGLWDLKMPADFPHPEGHRDQGKDTAAIHAITAIKYSWVPMETGSSLFVHCPGSKRSRKGRHMPRAGQRPLCACA